MSSRKYEKASNHANLLEANDSAVGSSCNKVISQQPGPLGGVGGFWKMGSAKGLPNRPHSSHMMTKAASLTFKDFEKSVSDAWDARDDVGTTEIGAADGRITHDSSYISPLRITSKVPLEEKELPSRHQTVVRGDQSRVSSTDLSKSTSPTSPSLPCGSLDTTKTKTSPKQRSETSTSSRALQVGGVRENKRFAKLEALIDASPSFELEELRRLAWSGISARARPKAWKILCGYLPPPGGGLQQHRAEVGEEGKNGVVEEKSLPPRRSQEEVVERKREEYRRYVKQYFATRHQDIHGDTYRQIHIDIPRMSPVVGLFQQRCVQEIFERILYIWAIRHPASGYVQGINDLVTPFFLVFLYEFLLRKGFSNYLASEVPFESVLGDGIEVETALEAFEREIVEADSYWCLTKVLDGIQDNYTFAQPGIQYKVRQLEELTCRIDSDLHEHLVGHDVAYLQFAFRWMNNLLMRELPIRATIRLWDTYLAQADGFSHFHLYVCAAFLVHWKQELMKRKDFHVLLMFLQNLPTAKWGNAEIELIVAEAYKLSYLFAGAPNHLNSIHGTLPHKNAAASVSS